MVSININTTPVSAPCPDESLIPDPPQPLLPSPSNQVTAPSSHRPRTLLLHTTSEGTRPRVV